MAMAKQEKLPRDPGDGLLYQTRQANKNPLRK